VTPRRSCVNWHFRWTCRLHLQGRKICHLFMLVPRSQIFLPWIWRQHDPMKRRFTQDLHGATSQKKAFFTVTTVKTSNPNIELSACQYFSSHTIKIIQPSEEQNKLEGRYALMTWYWSKLVLWILYETFSCYTLCCQRYKNHHVNCTVLWKFICWIKYALKGHMRGFHAIEEIA
jgi:hypothetical protein